MKLGQESRNIVFVKTKNNLASKKTDASFVPLKTQVQPSFQGFNTGKFKNNFSKMFDILKNVFTGSKAKFKVDDETFNTINTALDGKLTNLVDESKKLLADSRFTDKFKISGQTYIFEDRGFFVKIGKKLAYPFSKFWLDFTNNTIDKLLTIDRFKGSEFIQGLQNSPILKNRKRIVETDKIFDTLHGIFNKSGVPILNDAGEVIKEGLQVNRIRSLYTKVFSNNNGNYAVEAERAFNKVATGLVSGTFAARDFYNITRYHSDNHAEAKKAKDKRLKQEITRSSINALLIFGTLGALSKYANISKGVAIGALVTTTLISETVSRLLNGTPILPLNIEQAKKIHRKKYGTSRQGGIQDISNQMPTGILEAIVKNPNPVETYRQNVLSGGGYFKNIVNFAGKNDNEIQNKIGTEQEIAAMHRDKRGIKSKNKKRNTFFAGIITGITVLFALGFTVGYARKSEKISVFAEGVKKTFDNFIEKITTQSKLIEKKKFDKIIQKLNETGNNGIADEYTGLLNGRKIVTTKKGKEFYKLHYDKGLSRALFDIITFPINFILKIPKVGMNLFSSIYGKNYNIGATKHISQESIIAVYKKLGKKVDDPDFAKHVEESVRKTLNVNTSSHKNSELLGKFLLFNTLVPSYFFVNDFRNHELIESNGEDTDGISTTTKTKISQRFVNYFSNSLFINAFTALFGNLFNGSLIGATAVTAMTEFTNESAIRKLIGVPLKEMSKDELIEFDNNNYYAKGFKGKYMRFISKFTGKKPLGEKAKDQQKKLAQKKS